MLVYVPECMEMVLNTLNSTYLVFRKHLGVIGGHWIPKGDFNQKFSRKKVKSRKMCFFDKTRKILMKMGKKPRKSTDLAEPVRMVPLGGYLENFWLKSPFGIQ